MSDRIAKALANHDKNFNCCQSVACAYCDLVGVDEETMFKAAEAFGLGAAVLGTLDKYYCHSFMASGTHYHIYLPFDSITD